ncbi:MAG: HAMP domain-containing histidine kinase [Chloroflexi bacterium]|nr:HAMP domain-containing histidine kinase [Chloroflexota bacterium]
MKRRLVLLSLPLLLGLVACGATALGWLPNPWLYLEGDLGSLALLLGVLLTLLGAALALCQWRADRRTVGEVAAAQAVAAAERRRFLQRLDHELKNPLTAMRAGLANVREAGSPAGREEALASVETQTLRLTRLVGDLRKLGDLETQQLDLASLDVGDLLQEVVALARERPEASDRRLSLTLPQAPWPLPQIQADQDLLFLAVHNMVDNALKFTRAGDTIEVRAYEDGTRLVIEVADTGPGIPSQDLPHVWEELYRGQSARGIPGSGLGLALVHAIAHRHGGDATLRSREGQGTVFALRLPLQAVTVR